MTALAGTTLAVAAAPATAAPPVISILSVSSENVRSGEPVHVRFRATNNGSSNETVFVAVSGGLRCAAGCSASQAIGPGLSKTFEATVVGPKVGESEVLGLNLAVSVRIGTQTAFDHKMIFVHGAGRPPSEVSPSSAARPSSAVSQVSGQVRDGDGRPIAGAALTVRDSAGRSYLTTSGPDGGFSIKSSDGKPIAVGPITVEARKEGYETAHATVQGASGRAATVQLTLAAVAAPSPTPPSPSAEMPPAATLKEADGEDESSPLWIILGGLLVAAGLATLVSALIRRRNAPDRTDPAIGTPARVNAPASASGSSLADAPTAVLRVVRPDNDSGGGYAGPAR